MAVDDDVNSGAGPSSDLNLSFGDPLYLHPDDTSGSPIVTIKLTGTQNYKMWSIATTFALRNHNKLVFIDGTCKRESDNPSRANQWDIGEESHRNISSIGTTKPTATAFLGKIVDNNKNRFNNNNNHKGSRNSNSNNRGPNLNLKCTNCNKIGRIVDICFEIIGYPAGYVKKNFNSNSRLVSSNNASADPQSNGVSSNNAPTSNSLVSLSSEQLARLMNLLNENGVSTANANMARKNFMNIKGTFFNGSVKFNLNFKRFFNGNTDFVIGNISLTVRHPNGTQALITKIEDLKINNEVTLYDILVVPEYTVSLLSVHKLSRDSKLFVVFNESNCYIQDLKANQTVGIGKQHNGLYLFDMSKIVSNSCIASYFVSKTQWYQRLGHHADQVLDVLKTTLSLDSHSTSDHLWDT
ncbi:ribonuclease H-like domain-containing protein, partial [Tanacetum coccineum]